MNRTGSTRSAKIPPQEMLTNVVNALNTYRPDDEDNISLLQQAVRRRSSINSVGFELFPESDILCSENDKIDDSVRLTPKVKHKNDLYRAAISANFKEHIISIEEDFVQRNRIKKIRRRISEPLKYKMDNDPPLYDEIAPSRTNSPSEETNLLETITIGDLIRAIELVHAKEHTTVPAMRRKRTISLTKIIEGSSTHSSSS